MAVAYGAGISGRPISNLTKVFKDKTGPKRWLRRMSMEANLSATL